MPGSLPQLQKSGWRKIKARVCTHGQSRSIRVGRSRQQDSVKRHMLVLLTVSLFVLGGDAFCGNFHTSSFLCGQKSQG